MSDAVKTVKLRTPIEFGSQVIEELTFRPPTGKDMRHLPGDAGYPLRSTLWLAGRLSGQPDAVIDRLAGADLWEVVDVAGDFMPAGPKAGGESSEP